MSKARYYDKYNFDLDENYEGDVYDEKGLDGQGHEKNQETRRITVLSKKRYRKNDRVRLITEDLPLVGYGVIRNMEEVVKIPKVRSLYLREAFFKCYFQGPYYKSKDFQGAFNIFTSLFYYKEDIREATRKLFDTFNEKKIIKPQSTPVEYEEDYMKLRLYLNGLRTDGLKTLENLPAPKTKLPPKDIQQDLNQLKEFVSKKETIDISFNPKKSDFPPTEHLFAKLAGCDDSDIIHSGKKTFLQLHEKDYGHLNFARISNQLWVQSLAHAIYNFVDEIEKEIIDTGVLHAKINVANIKQAITHFEQHHQDAKLMDEYQKAYFISKRYRKRSVGNKDLKRSSILKAFARSSN
jgi:hypothetical protein